MHELSSDLLQQIFRYLVSRDGQAGYSQRPVPRLMVRLKVTTANVWFFFEPAAPFPNT